MKINTLIHQIQLLPLSDRFFVMEQTLKSIKDDDSRMKQNYLEDENLPQIVSEETTSYLISQKSLAMDWLSEKDNRWDNLLKNV